jgi:hypothetical protein
VPIKNQLVPKSVAFGVLPSILRNVRDIEIMSDSECNVPYWGSVAWGCYKSAGGLTPKWRILEKSLPDDIFSFCYHFLLSSTGHSFRVINKKFWILS